MRLAQEFATGQSGIGCIRSIESLLSLHWHSAGIIEPVFVPYLQQHNIGIFKHGNARPHTARHSQNIVRIHNINVLQWPARSPGLCPIEHLWDHLGLQVRERHDVNNIRDLERALQAEWVRTPLQHGTKLQN